MNRSERIGELLGSHTRMGSSQEGIFWQLEARVFLTHDEWKRAEQEGVLQPNRGAGSKEYTVRTDQGIVYVTKTSGGTAGASASIHTGLDNPAEARRVSLKIERAARMLVGEVDRKGNPVAGEQP